MENKYYLAVETKPNNYFPINLNDIKIPTNTTKLEEIDSITKNYTKDSLINNIKEANIVDVNSSMSLVVVYIEKEKMRKIEALTKDYTFDMWQYLKDNYQDKNFCTKIINFLNNKISEEDLNKMKELKGTNEFLGILNALPYLAQRKLYFYLYEN